MRLALPGSRQRRHHESRVPGVFGRKADSAGTSPPCSRLSATEGCIVEMHREEEIDAENPFAFDRRRDWCVRPCATAQSQGAAAPNLAGNYGCQPQPDECVWGMTVSITQEGNKVSLN